MESILEKLLVADNNSIQEGTKELREAFKDPGVISSLCNVLVSSSNPQVRQYAAVLLRKRLSKSQHWTRLSAEAKAGIKEGLIQVYVKEQEKVVKNAIVQLIGTIMKLESCKLGWPEMMECLKMWVNSSVLEEKLLGLFALSILAEVVPDMFMEQYPVALYFSQMLVQTLRMPDISSSPLAHLTLVCLAHFAPPVQHDQIAALYTESIPTMLSVIGDLAKNRPGNSALEAMQVIDELLENNPAVLQPYLRLLVNFCLDIAVTRLPSITDEMRNKALNTLSEVVRVKKRVIVRDDLVSPILRVVFELIGKIPAGSGDGGEEEEQEEYFVDDEDDSTPTTCANQLLDTMALHLPPDKLLPLLMEYVEPNVTSADPCARKAAYLSMAMVSEGCADYVRTKHLEQFLRYVCQGITEQNTPVRNAALFALGQFSEHLQPEISVYSKELMPVLMEFLVELNKAGAAGDGGGEVARKAGVDRMFYALEMFCENLDEALLPYLQPLMEHLLPLVVPPHATHVRELAISAIGATANAAKTNMLPYFETVMKHLQHYLTEEQTEETLCLQIQAVDTVGVFARTVGADNFMPMAVESIELGLKLLSKVDDPDLRKAVYGLFASVSSVLKLNMASYLPAILEPIMNSVKSEDGIVAHYDDETSAFPDPDELSGEEGDDEDIDKDSDVSSDDVTAYTVVNAYVEEKEEACLALKEVAANTCHAFLPFLHACFEETIKLLRFPHDYVKKAALEAVTQFVINFFDPVSQQSQEVKREALSLLIPKLSEMVRTEEEIEVVMVALNSFTELLKELGSDAIQGEGHPEAVLECIKDVLTHKTECQNDMDEEEEAMDEEAEQDELLVESAGEIVPHLGKALGPEAFSYHYSHLLPLFQALTKKKCSPAQRSFGVGVIAECMSALGERTVVFKDTLLPLLIGLSSDRDADVRNNAIFALGELALHAKAGLFAEYAQVLHALSTAVATETHAATLDNIVAALARLIVTNVDAIPLDQVLPVYVQYLPLREDYEENKWIFKSFEILYQKGSDSLRNLLVPVIKISTSVIHKEQIEPENKDLVINLLRQCHLDFPNDCVTAASQMTPEEAEILRSICTAS